MLHVSGLFLGFCCITKHSCCFYPPLVYLLPCVSHGSPQEEIEAYSWSQVKKKILSFLSAVSDKNYLTVIASNNSIS